MDNLGKIYDEVAQELGLSKKLVKEIAEAQFSFVVNTMTAKDLNDVRLQYWGKFSIKPKRVQYFSKETQENIKKKLDGFNK